MSSVEALTRRRTPWIESIRVILLVAASFLAVLPFLTSRMIGGVDARWYAFMLKGFTDQIGSGHIPFLIGEGPYAWNGGVHPFRSAPVYMLVGGLWKILTLGRAGAYTLQHLTVLTSAVAGTLGFYRAATLILGARRWTACAFALVYLFTPSWLATVYKADAYMSYMAFAAMPLVLFGNARTLMQADGKGYMTLGIGLALMWMCHPPIALLTTTATLFIQAASVVANGVAAWKRAALGAGLFAVLAAYYFGSMSELPPIPEGGGSRPHAVALLVGIALFLVGLGRSAFFPRRLAWILVAAAGSIVITRLSTPWLVWALFTLGFVAAAAGLVRHAKLPHPQGTAVMALFLCALAGAAAAEGYLGRDNPGSFSTAVSQLAVNTGGLSNFLSPLPRAMDNMGIFQPGWSVLLAGALGAVGLFLPGPIGPRVFAAAAITFGVCYLRVPMISNFLVGYYPPTLSSITGLPLPLRVTPVLSSFALAAGLLWVAARAPGRPGEAVVTRLLLISAVAWSGYQAYSFVRIGYELRGSEALSERSIRTENAIMDRYAYDLLPIPKYYSNGITDPILESRLLRADGTVLIGPKEIATAMEARHVQNHRLVGQVIPGSSSWFDIVPTFVLQPGEHKLLRFEFDPGLNYNGFFIFSAEHSYREYHLPDAGQSEAFGVGEPRSHILSFWNSGTTTEHYRVLESREPGNNINDKGGFFADLSVSDLEPSALPIRLLSIYPYHATVNAPAAATLETFRILLPGYKAYVDGNRVPIGRSREALITVPVPAGIHDVELRFVGSVRLWISALVSSVAWAMTVVIWTMGKRRAAAAH